jgi:hypothetical protein
MLVIDLIILIMLKLDMIFSLFEIQFLSFSIIKYARTTVVFQILVFIRISIPKNIYVRIAAAVRIIIDYMPELFRNKNQKIYWQEIFYR